ncbi:MAG: DUF4105 domain-containing protein [Bacteroidota bacterium]
MKRLLIACVVLFSFLPPYAAKAQQDSSGLQISLLTCSPGAELYSVFGHNALRIVDSAAGTDIVYNYGTFDFNDPDFYTKFVRGKLLYFVSQVSYNDFLFEYQYFKRGVKEQVLNLSHQEKKKRQADLFENVREENRYYKYDFLYDNCTTRLRDIIFQKNKYEVYQIPGFTPQGQTFRDHLHVYLDRAQMRWTALGIDLLLGLEADIPMTQMESMFLPDFLYKGVSLATMKQEKMERKKIEVLADMQPTPVSISFYLDPLFVFIVFCIALLLPSFYFTSLQSLADGIWLIVTGLLGLFLLFMWFGTDHQSFSKNLNLLWAFPLNLYFAFKLNDIKKWMRQFFKAWSLVLLVLIAISLTNAGVINTAFYPLMLLASFRYWILSKKVNNYA